MGEWEEFMLDIYKDKKIFITGASGFKGTWLTSMLLYLGAEVKGYSLVPNEVRNHFELLNNNFEHNFHDIKDLNALSHSIHSFNPDLIIHMAAQPLVRQSYIDPYGTFETNIIGSMNIFEACDYVDSILGIINVTTDKVYLNLEKSTGYKESDSLWGHDPYSASKVCSEQITSCYRNIRDYIITSARAGNVLGGGDWSEDRIIPDIIRSTVRNKKVVIRNSNSVRPWQHVLDVLYGYLLIGERILNKDPLMNSSFNFGPDNDNLASVLSIVNTSKTYWDKIDYITDINKDSFHETSILTLNSDKAKDILKWKPKYNVEKTIEKTITWYKEFYYNNNLITYDQIEDYFGEM